MANKKGELVIDFSNISGGMNTTDPANSLRENQAQFARNVFILQRGWKRAPGFTGLSSSATIAATAKMLDIYYRTDGTDILMMVAGGKLYSVNKTTNATTELYNLTGTGEAYGDSCQDKYFCANGTACCKVEGTTAYKLGIAAPTGASAAAQAGGSLPDGVYAVYVSYARGSSLYSYAESLGNVTLGTGNNTIRITFPNSSDSQVSNKVVWLMEPGSSTIYFYHQTNDNTTTTVDVASAAAKNTSKLYRILGEQSVVPPALKGIVYHKNSLYGWINNVLYKSLPGTTVYDLERWPDITYTFPFKIDGIFSLGEHLYLNSNRGIFVLPYGDMSAEWTQISKRLYFKYFRTVEKTDDENFVIGVTNDGVRTFDGTKFSIDLSKDIKPEIDKLYSGSTSAFLPCAFVYNRSFRTEYRLSYRDTSLGSTCNNRQLVLNMDTLYWEDNNQYNASWETWDHGFAYAAVDGSNIAFMLQVISGSSQVIKENTASSKDINHYDKTGVLITTATAKTKDVKSRVVVPSIMNIEDWEGLWIYSMQGATANAYLYAVDDFDLYDERTVLAEGQQVALFGTAIFDESLFTRSRAMIQRLKIKQSIRGGAFYFRYLQENDDALMQVYEVKAISQSESGRYS
jgi:hypothetical protein